MKKILALVLALCMVMAFAACGSNADNETTNGTADTTDAAADTTGGDETTTNTDDVTVMTYAEYAAAELDTEVTIEAYVQATQSWWNDSITVYAQDQDGAYFLYNMACSEEDAAKLVAGTKIRVNGYKAAFNGEIEIADGTFEFVEDGETYIAEPVDVTALLGTDELIDCQNQKVSFTGMTVEASTDSEGNEVAFLYGWDGSGSHDSNSDLYFNVSVNGQTYNFCVESYLCGNTTDVYAAVEALQIGDVINLEGFLYWYVGVNPHITSVSAAE